MERDEINIVLNRFDGFTDFKEPDENGVICARSIAGDLMPITDFTQSRDRVARIWRAVDRRIPGCWEYAVRNLTGCDPRINLATWDTVAQVIHATPFNQAQALAMAIEQWEEREKKRAERIKQNDTVKGD